MKNSFNRFNAEYLKIGFDLLLFKYFFQTLFKELFTNENQFKGFPALIVSLGTQERWQKKQKQ